MKEKEISELLARYWRGETSRDEESALQSFFSEEDVPKQWEIYRPLFAWKNDQSRIRPSSQLKIRARKPISVRFYPLIRVVASVLLVLFVGIGLYTHYEQEKYMEEVFSETYSNPEDAIKETREILGKVSSSLMKVQNYVLVEESKDSVVNKK